MKRLSVILLMFALILGTFNSIQAQNNKERFSPCEFIKRMESFIVREACLSPQEAEAFFPLFHEMHNKQRGINWKIQELKNRTLATNASDKEYANVIKEISKLKIESAELEDTYYRKLCKAVSAKKVHLALKAEDDYHRKMLMRFGRNQSNKNDRRNPPHSQHNRNK